MAPLSPASSRSKRRANAARAASPTPAARIFSSAAASPGFTSGRSAIAQPGGEEGIEYSPAAAGRVVSDQVTLGDEPFDSELRRAALREPEALCRLLPGKRDR